MEQGEAILIAGVVLFVGGLLFFMAFNPLFTSLSMRMFGYESGGLTNSDVEYYIMLGGFIMPLVTVIVGLGLALFVTGGFLYMARKK